MENAQITRRRLIAGALALTGLPWVQSSASGQLIPRSAPAENPYAPFNMGIQTYSLRGYNLQHALDRTSELGLHYWEAFPTHIPLTTDATQLREMKAAVLASDVELTGWGVAAFGASLADNRAIFEFAAAMELKLITADPSPEALPILDKLLNEYKDTGIYVAIHNHGPGSRYSTIAEVSQALKGRHPRLGACVDTGHFMHSGEDPVEAVKQFGKRTFEIHLKDVKNHTVATELGKGDLRTEDLLRELLRLKYNGLVALEYEEHVDNPMPYLRECLTAAQQAIVNVNKLAAKPHKR